MKSTQSIWKEGPMENPYQHIPIEEAANRLKERMKAIGFNEIIIEDDDPDFKNFYGKSDQLFEDSLFYLQILLYELHNDDGSGAGILFWQ